MQLTQSQRPEQKQILTQAMRQSLEILQMPLPELGAYLQEQVLANPLLALDEPADAPARPEEHGQHSAESSPDTPDEAEGDRFESAASEAAALWDAPHLQQDMPAAPWSAADSGDTWDAVANLPDTAGESLPDTLREQLLRMPHLTEEVRVHCLYLAECLDENGFLPFGLEELAAEQHAPLFVFEQALYVLQELQPAGVGARTLEECLLLQLARTSDFSAHTVRLVREGLPLLAKNNMPGLARLLGCTPAQAAKAALAVRALCPRPARGYGKSRVVYAVPEAVLSVGGGAVHIEPNRRLLPRLALHAESCALLRESDDEQAQSYLRARNSEAKQLMRCVADRETTLLRVVSALTQLQAGYFLRGEALRPLTLAELAEHLSLSLSTVSRAVQGKTVLFRGKSVPLKALFSTAIPAAGSEVSAESVKRQLRLFIDAEDKAHPLSDEALCAALGGVQLPVSRRTVAKYREELHIAPSAQRKRG